MLARKLYAAKTNRNVLDSKLNIGYDYSGLSFFWIGPELRYDPRWSRAFDDPWCYAGLKYVVDGV